MPPETPHSEAHHNLPAMASRYIDPDTLPWLPSPFPGIDIKILMQDPETGMSTALTRFAPGAQLPEHEHVALEQTYVLEGSLVDAEGEAVAGQYVWRPGGSIHNAVAPNGALVLSVFLKPNRFLDV
ncbi:MAG: cupin domain-containing protein [Burkholderiaceae bacterium]